MKEITALPAILPDLGAAATIAEETSNEKMVKEKEKAMLKYVSDACDGGRGVFQWCGAA